MENALQLAEEKLRKVIGVDLESCTVKIGKYDIHYVFAGMDTGIPILLIHGLNVGWGNWFGNISDLAKFFKVYAIDLPGSGQSTKIDFYQSDIEKDYVDVVEEFIEKLGLKKFYIIGHSFGGWIALKLMLRNKIEIEKVILVDAVGFSSAIVGVRYLIAMRPVANFLAKTIMKPTKKNMKAFFESAMVDSSNLKEEFIEYFYQGVIRDKTTHPFQMMNHFMKPFKFRSDLSLVSELPKINRPVLVITGDKDRIVDFKKNYPYYQKIPKVKIAVFPNTGHAPPIEKSSQFNKTVLDFLLEENKK